MEYEGARPNIIRKGEGQGTAPTGEGSTVEFVDGGVTVGGVGAGARLVLHVQNRDAMDFFDLEKTYDITFTEVI